MNHLISTTGLRTGCRLTALLAALLLMLAPLQASADQEASERAKALFSEGNTQFEKGAFSAALAKFQQANRLMPSIQILLNIALTQEKLEQWVAAADTFEAFLARVDKAAYPGKVKAVGAKLTRLRGKVASITLLCGVPGATVKVEGKEVGATPLKQRHYREPGSFQLEVSKDGHQTFYATLKLDAGQHRELQVELKPVPTASAPEPAPAAAVKPAEPETVPTSDEARPIYKKWWFWTIIGAVVVGATTTGVVATQTGGSDRLPAGELGSRSMN